MKKKILAALLSGTMILGMTGCGNSSNEESAPAAESTAAAAKTEEAASTAAAESTDEPITLRMAWWGSQTRHDITVQAIELYESEHPNVTIEYEFYSFDDYFTKLKTLVASDQVWDIFQLGGNFPQYMDKIYYLNDFIDSGVVDVSDISDSYLKITQDTDGNQIGLSNGLNTYGIAYDVDLFNEAGVPLPTEDWTWDDFKSAAEKIHEYTGDFGVSGFTSSEFIAGCSTYIGQQGSVGQYSFFNLDLTGMGFDDPQMLTPYIQMRADSIKNEVYPDAGASAEITNSTAVMMQTVEGNASAIGYMSMGSLGKNDKIKAVQINGVDATPANVSNGSYVVSRPFNIVTKSDGVSDAAQDFINYILSDEGQAIVEQEDFIKTDATGAYESNGTTGKTISVAGSSSVTPVMQVLAEKYEAVSGNKVEVNQSDSSTGVSSAIDGTCDIGIAVIVNSENTVTNLTLDQVGQIYKGELTEWSQVTAQ